MNILDSDIITIKQNIKEALNEIQKFHYVSAVSLLKEVEGVLNQIQTPVDGMSIKFFRTPDAS